MFFNPFAKLYALIRDAAGIEWLPFLVTGAVIIICTAIVCAIVTALIKRYLSRGKAKIPSMSIYINIGRICVWAIGISILLATCFDIDVSGLVTALGVGGIAISLGFKDTINNLISGVQVTSCKIMEPGDYVSVGDKSGIVVDTTWRHTKIRSIGGEDIIMPNSIINSSSVVKKKALNCVKVELSIGIDLAKKILSNQETFEKKLQKELCAFGQIAENPVILFTDFKDGNAKGFVTVKFKKKIDVSTHVKAKDIIFKTLVS